MKTVLYGKSPHSQSNATRQSKHNIGEESSQNTSNNLKRAISPLMIHKQTKRMTQISQGRISLKTNNHIKKNGVDGFVTQSNNNTPHTPVSIEFAAKQFFQILLMDIKSRHTFDGKLGLVASANQR